jgi:hypothetical protein
MRIGWLWFDNTKGRTLEQKVLNAAEHYQAKFNHAPDTCYVHPKAVEGEQQIGAVHVVPAKHVLLHHFFLGVNGDD